MGWKIFTAFIKDTGFVEINEELVSSLGFKDFSFVEKTAFSEGCESGELFISNHNGNLLITNADLVWQFTKDEITKVEELFVKQFPKSEIFILNLGYGTYFALIENGIKIRVREVGDEVYQDRGKLLPEEEYLKTLELIDAEDLAEMKKELTDDEIENQYQSNLAYETAFELTKRYFGKRYDELELSEYEFKSHKFKNTLINSVSDYGKITEMQFVQ